MSLFSDPETHAANPPESWTVWQPSPRVWHLSTRLGIGTLDTFRTKREALAAKTSGHLFDLWHREARWYAGESIPGWRDYAELVTTSRPKGEPG